MPRGPAAFARFPLVGASAERGPSPNGTLPIRATIPIHIRRPFQLALLHADKRAAPPPLTDGSATNTVVPSRVPEDARVPPLIPTPPLWWRLPGRDNRVPTEPWKQSMHRQLCSRD